DRFPTEGVAMLCWSLEHSGPLGATVEDVRLAFAVCTGESLELPAGRRFRLGISSAWWAGADPEVAQVTRAALDRLVADGAAELVEVALPHIDLALPVGVSTFLAEGAAAMDRWLDADAAFSPTVRIALESARGLSAPAY